METEPVPSDPWVRPGRFVVLSVSDTGCGISAEVRDRIFEPFFSTKEVGKGTGLGLATVYGIVKQHEGFIEVASAGASGTQFDIYLPAGVPGEEAPEELSETTAAPGGGGETILLAEDDEMVRKLATRILERAGYRVLTARDGDEALERFRRHMDEIGLSILDVVMPRRSGRAVYDQIHALRPDLPILFVSGYSYNILEAGGVYPEEYEVLPKPFRKEDLLERVNRLLKDARLSRPERPASVRS
ncbi:MAG: response regulator [Desulfococcaceae bacterium]